MTVETDVQDDENKEFSDAFAERTATPSSSDDNDLNNDGDASLSDDDEQHEIANDDQSHEEQGSQEQEQEQEQKSAIDWEQKYKSDHGRLLAMNKRNQELEALLAKPRADTPEAQAEQDEQKFEKLAELKEEFPEIADALDEFKASILAETSQREQSLAQQIQPLQQKLAQDEWQRELDALEASHPDWQDIRFSPEFDQWLDQKPASVKQMINSESAADAAYLLDTFKLETGTNRSQRSDQIKQQNQQKLRANVAVPTSRNPRREVGDDDFSSAFSSAVARKDRHRR